MTINTHLNGEAETILGQAEETAAQGKKPAVLDIMCLADVETQPVEWLWDDWIALGTLSLLDGDPGKGKSTITCDLTARVSRGWAMPPHPGGEVVRPPREVLLLSAEDDLKRTIRPRLEAAGANLKMVRAFSAVGEGDEQRPPVLPYDLQTIEKMLAGWRTALVIIDPLMAYLGTDVDSHKDQDIRRCLHQLKLLAERTNAAILLVRHLNKMGHGVAMYRGGGSIGIIGQTRSAMIVGIDPEDPNRRVLACQKNNLAPMPRSLTYALESTSGINRVAVVGWGGESDLGANDILSHPGQGSGKKGKSRSEEAAEWMKKFLIEKKATCEEQAILAETFWAAATEAKFNNKNVADGKKLLGGQVKASNRGKFRGQWHWWIEEPQADYETPPGTFQSGESSESSDSNPCSLWLREQLSSGGKRRTHLLAEGERKGYPGKQIGQAKQELRLEEYERDGYKFWRLPEQATDFSDLDGFNSGYSAGSRPDSEDSEDSPLGNVSETTSESAESPPDIQEGTL